jgi:hypothetical protein
MPQRQSVVLSPRERILREVVRVLAEAAALRDSQGRLQWRRELFELLDGDEWAEFATAQQEFVEATRFCARQVGGLDALVEATSLVAPATRHRLAPLAEEVHAMDFYGGRDWEPLRSTLQVPVHELNATVALIMGDRIRLPAYCDTAWRAFVHLSGRSAQPGTVLSPGMVLLEHLALHADLASSVGEFYAWNDHFAEMWEVNDLEGGLRELRESLSAQGSLADVFHSRAPRPAGLSLEKVPASATRPVIRMYIKLAPDLAPAESSGRRNVRRGHRYWISSRVRYAESAGLHHEDEGEGLEPVPRSQLPAAVAKLLTRMATLWRDRAEDVVLEFFLPTELLNEPVEWWDRDPTRPYPNPLFSKYPEIFLHSLERLQRRDLHHGWRLRWARWKSDPDSAGVHWCEPEEGRSIGDHLQFLDAQIGQQDDVVAMVLSEPPLPRNAAGVGELRIGLDLGVPVFIHHRESVTEEFRSVVREGLAEGGLAKLPTYARQWKGSSATRGSSVPNALVRHMSLIWDDPEHLLDGGASAPASFVGGIE